MRTIHKFMIDVTDQVNVEVSGLTRWLSVQEQRGMLCVWAEVDEEGEAHTETLFIRGTGHRMTGAEGDLVDTVQQLGGQLVWHVFAEKREKVGRR